MQKSGWRLAAIALLAMLVRAVVPAGFMLAAADTPHGRYLTVELCEGHTAAQVIDLDTGKAVDLAKIAKAAGKTGQDKTGQDKTGQDKTGHDKDKSAPCVFAATAHVAAPATVAELDGSLIQHDVVFQAVRDVRPGRGIAAPPPPSTGPPSSI